MANIRFSINPDVIFSIPPFVGLDKYLAIEFKGLVYSESNVCLMVETISRNIPPPPMDVDFGGFMATSILDEWQNGTIIHRLVVCEITKSSIFQEIFDGTVIPTFGTNLTVNGLVVQVLGKGESVSQFLENIKQVVKISKITTSLDRVAYQQSMLDEKVEKTLEMAHNLGFYHNPKNISLRGLSQHLHMSKSSISNQLRIAENRLIEKYLDDR